MAALAAAAPGVPETVVKVLSCNKQIKIKINSYLYLDGAVYFWYWLVMFKPSKSDCPLLEDSLVQQHSEPLSPLSQKWQ